MTIINTPSPSLNLPNTPDTAATKYRRKMIIMAIGGFFLFIAIVFFIHWLFWGRFNLSTENAYVGGNIIQVMPQVSGTVISVNTEETQWVAKGKPLIKIDPTNAAIALELEKANLAQAVRQVRQYFEQVSEAQATLSVYEAGLKEVQAGLKRRMRLNDKKMISPEELQHYETEAATQQARYNSALHTVTAARAVVENTHLYTHPLVEAAKASLKIAYLNFQRTIVVAPISGYVAKKNVELGQQISPSSVLLAIIPLHGTWVEANYKESDLYKLRIDQSVTLHADAYPSVIYHGKVMGLSAGTGSAFSLLPPQNATGNWIKITQRLPVRILLEAKELQENPLQLGLSMRVTTNIRHNDNNGRLATAITPSSDNTAVYATQVAKADKLISKILHENSPDMSLAKS